MDRSTVFLYFPSFANKIERDISGEYDQQMKQSPSQQQQQQQQTQPPQSDAANFNYTEDQSNDTNAILKLKESMQEEVKKFDKTPNNSNNDDYNHFSGIG